MILKPINVNKKINASRKIWAISKSTSRITETNSATVENEVGKDYEHRSGFSFLNECKSENRKQKLQRSSELHMIHFALIE